jgi:sugar O-acyltransferase (sialic acid O-acetyltransferase NeuD family)
VSRIQKAVRPISCGWPPPSWLSYKLKSMKALVLFGLDDAAELARFYFEKDAGYHVVAFTADGQFIKEDSFCGVPAVPFEEVARSFPHRENDMHIAIGYSHMNRVRRSKYDEARAMGYQLATYVSPRCTYLSDHEPGDNCFIYEDNTIQPFVRIGNNVILWSGNHIGHHSVIDDHNFISSHVVVSGRCHIESFCFLGVNSTIGDHVRIAEGTLLGAGAVISKDTEKNGVYVPPRATKLEKTSDQVSL